MKNAALPKINLKYSYLLSFFLLTSLALSLTVVWQSAHGQQAKLSLADILIGLRSKKVTIEERNKLLTEAVKVRGITFVLTPEIESELKGTGADGALVEAIRQKSAAIKIVATPVPTPLATPIPTPMPTPVVVKTPVPTPTPPDSAFYRKRADESIVKGELDAAVSDYNKALELNPKDTSIYLNRGLAFYNKKNYDLAIADYDKAIELNPKESMFYFNRGNSYERMGNVPKAVADYRMAVEIDSANESAKVSLQRLQAAEQTKTQPAPNVAGTTMTTQQQQPSTDTTQPLVKLGQLTAEMAVNMVAPIYSASAKKFNIQGKVTVEVTLDDKGNVTSAKAIDGPQLLRAGSEDAAKKSKFKPAMSGGRAVQASGFIVYGFKFN